MRRYEKYKDSGIDWLGEIPEHWEVKRLKNVFQIFKRIAGEVGHNVLSITQGGIKVKDVTSGEGQLAMDYSKYQYAYEGDFAMNQMDLLTGWVDISKFNGVISPDYRVFNLIDKSNIPDYFLNLLQDCYRSKIFYAHGQGVSMMGRWRFPAENFNNFYFPIPAPNEQKSIVGFLEDKCEKIDSAVGLKEQQIEKLKELRQITIHNAVTRGLPRHAESVEASLPMKDSGIDWIGEIPEHWEVKRFKFLCSITTGNKNTEDKVKNGMYPFYVRSQIEERINSYSFDGEAILTAGDGAGVGKVYHYVNGKFDFHQRVYKFSDFSEVIGKYLYMYLLSEFYNVAILGTAKSTVDSLRLPLIQDFMIAYPNNTIEQKAIVTYLEEQTSKIDKAIAQKREQIIKLKEYKQSLINEVVTGKVKVTA